VRASALPEGGTVAESGHDADASPDETGAEDQ
jgi:hypothetical protein